MESDLEPMMRIGHEGIRPYVEAIWGWDQVEQEHRFRESFNLTTTNIVTVDGRDVGYIDVQHHDDHLFLAGIYLDREHRGRGIGTELISDLVAKCRQLRKSLGLRVLRTNPAQHLYKRLGFSPIGEDETHVYMERTTSDVR